MLVSVATWFPTRSWEIIGWLAWIGGLIETLRAARTSEGAPSKTAWWQGWIIVAFFALRWGFWMEPQEHSPDESQSLSGALTLWSDPVFWRSVDGATAGPLHYYMLMPATLFHGSQAYIVARLIGHLLVLGTLFLAGRMVGRATHPFVERAAVFIGVSAFAFSRTLDNHHTSTEVLPTFLLTVAAACLTRPARTRLHLVAAGLALGAIPWAKLQAAPIALGIGAWALFFEWRQKRESAAASLLISALVPTLLISVALSAFNLWADMLTPYLLKNASYPAESAYTVTEVAWSGFLNSLFEDGQAGIWLVAGCGLVLVCRVMPVGATAALRSLALFAFGWLALALISVAITRRPFFHYWYLVSAPWLLIVGVALEQGRLTIAQAAPGPVRTTLLCGAMLALFAIPMALYRVAGPWRTETMHHILQTWQVQNQELAGQVRPYIKADDRMAIWGWRSALYIDLGLAQATRQAHSEAQIRENPLQAYFLRTYWADFQKNRPAVFVDAVGPDNFGFQNRNRAHESFRLLAEAVRRDYTLIADNHGVRLYVRNDRAPAKP